MQERIDSLEVQLGKERQTIERARQVQQDQYRLIDEMRHQYGQEQLGLMQERDALKDSLQALTEENEFLKQQLHQAQQSKIDSCSQLETQLETCKEQNEILYQQLTSLRNENHQLQGAVEQLSSRCQVAEGDCTRFRQTADEYEFKYKALQERMQSQVCSHALGFREQMTGVLKQKRDELSTERSASQGRQPAILESNYKTEQSTSGPINVY